MNIACFWEKRRAYKPPNHNERISMEVLMKLAILPGPQAGQAQEVTHKFMCTAHQADQVANVSKPQDQGRSSNKLMLVSLVEQLYTRSREYSSTNERTNYNPAARFWNAQGAGTCASPGSAAT